MQTSLVRTIRNSLSGALLGRFSRTVGTVKANIPLTNFKREAFITLENPTEWAIKDEQFTDRLEDLFKRVGAKFRAGHDIVVVNIGPPIDLADSCEMAIGATGSLGANASSKLHCYTDRISKETGRTIDTFEGIRKANSKTIKCFYQNGPYDKEDASSLPLEVVAHIGEDALPIFLNQYQPPPEHLEHKDTCYVVLFDVKKVQSVKYPDSYATLVLDDPRTKIN